VEVESLQTLGVEIPICFSFVVVLFRLGAAAEKSLFAEDLPLPLLSYFRLEEDIEPPSHRLDP